MSRVLDADAAAIRSSAALKGTRGRPQESLLSRGVAMVIMLTFTVYFLIPIWWLLVASTKSSGQLFSTNPISLPTSLDHSFITSSALLRPWKLTIPVGRSIFAYTDPSTTSRLSTSSTSGTVRSRRDVRRGIVTRV